MNPDPKPYDGFEENYSCQFHVVEISTSLGNDNALRGKIWSWDWIVSAWEPARTNGLPAQTGFSEPIDLRVIANKVNVLVEGGGSINGRRAKEQVPELDFLTRERLTELRSILQNEFKVAMIAEGGNAKLSFWKEE
jgi:hypothetical protein